MYRIVQMAVYAAFALHRPQISVLQSQFLSPVRTIRENTPRVDGETPENTTNAKTLVDLIPKGLWIREMFEYHHSKGDIN